MTWFSESDWQEYDGFVREGEKISFYFNVRKSIFVLFINISLVFLLGFLKNRNFCIFFPGIYILQTNSRKNFILNITCSRKIYLC